MPIMPIYIFFLAFWAFVLMPSFCAATDDTLESIRSRIAAISEMSSRSISGHFIVTGTNRLENVALASWCEEVTDRVESVTGFSLPFNNRTVHLNVSAENAALPEVLYVQVVRRGNQWFHLVYLEDYDVAYSSEGLQRLCASLLAAYVGVSLNATEPAFPPWLVKGVEQNLWPKVRAENIEKVLALWRSGGLISFWDILGDGSPVPPDRLDDPQRLAAYGVFVHWLTDLPTRQKRFQALFKQLSAGQPLTMEKLTLLVSEGGELRADEAWERWLIQQEHVVYALGMVSTRLIDQLRSELLIYPGVCGIPLSVELPKGSLLAQLVPLRKEDWIASFVRQKRSRLDLLAAGRSESFRSIIVRLGQFLSNLEKGASGAVLLRRLEAVNAALTQLSEKVEAAGGILTE